MGSWPGGGIFNDTGDDEEVGGGVFHPDGPDGVFNQPPADDVDGPVKRGAEDPTRAQVREATAEVIPPDEPAGEQARDVGPRARPRRQGIAMRVVKDAKGRPVQQVARTVEGRTVEAWRAPSAGELAHVRANGRVTKMGEVPAVQPTQEGGGWVKWALVAAVVGGGYWWWTKQSPATSSSATEGAEGEEE